MLVKMLFLRSCQTQEENRSYLNLAVLATPIGLHGMQAVIDALHARKKCCGKN